MCVVSAPKSARNAFATASGWATCRNAWMPAGAAPSVAGRWRRNRFLRSRIRASASRQESRRPQRHHDNSEARMDCSYRIAIMIMAMSFAARPAVAQSGEASRGERLFRACAPCHSLEPNRNMTGPSLAELWNRRAGTLETFNRYSPALKSSGITWDDKTLDPWIMDPQHLVPGNTMTFPGLKD